MAKKPPDELPPAPREMLTQLLDDLRKMGHMVGAFCYICGRPLCEVHEQPPRYPREPITPPKPQDD